MIMDKDNFISTAVIIGTAVANGGTFTVPYPTGYNAGDFSNARGHYLSLNGSKLQQPEHITLSFGATAVTVTNGTGDTIPSGHKGYFQFEIRADRLEQNALPPVGSMKRVKVGNLESLFIDFGSPAASDTDGILDGVAATDSAATYTIADFVSTFDGTLDVPRNLILTGTAGSNHVIIVTGKDVYDQPMQETFTLDGTNAQAGLKAFSQVISFAVAVGAADDTFDAGWGDVFGLPLRLEAKDIIAEIQAGAYQGLSKEDVFVPFSIDATKYAAGTSIYGVSPVAGAIIGAQTVVEVETTGAGALGVELGGTAVDGLSVVIATGATVGTLDSDTATAGDASTAIAANGAFEITGDGTPSAGAVNGQLQIRPNTTVNGTFVAGLAANTKATATNADVRGTYAPTTAADGTTSFALHAMSPQIEDLGNYQYSA